MRVALPHIICDTCTRNLASGEETSERDVLAFRDHDALNAALRRAGYEVTRVHGDWSEAPLTDEDPEVITIARRR